VTPRAGQLRADLPNALGGGPVLLRWTEWGRPAGAPVVCVHGLTRNGRDFDALAMELARRGCRVICPDVPGRGHSSWLADGALYAVPTYLAVFAPLLEALGEYDWVGTSMGGLIGMGVCATPGNRMRRFVINDVGPFVPLASLERIRDYLNEPQRFASLSDAEAYLRRVHAPFGALSDAEWQHLALHSARATERGDVVLHYDPAIVQPMLGPLTDIDLWALWPLVAQRPVLVLRGEDSDLLLAETAAQMGASPGVRVETIAHCGHAPALMDAAQIALVAGFLV
jgi:pimeloyl-ACP methyl ester carboxylesterase